MKKTVNTAVTAAVKSVIQGVEKQPGLRLICVRTALKPILKKYSLQNLLMSLEVKTGSVSVQMTGTDIAS